MDIHSEWYHKHHIHLSITCYDMRYVTVNHKHFILSNYWHIIFLENLSHYSLIRILTIFYDYFLLRLLNAFTQFQASDRLGALFGVSILEDKGHARNELWDIMYQMSSVLCKFSTFTFEYYFDEEMHEEKLYFLLDK